MRTDSRSASQTVADKLDLAASRDDVEYAAIDSARLSESERPPTEASDQLSDQLSDSLSDLALERGADKATRSSDATETLVIACATDDNYVMPLAVTLLTAAKHLRRGAQIQLYLLDGGISEENRQRLQASWADQPIDVIWIKPDHELVSSFRTSHHISSVAYYRILLPHVLPESLDRVLYLDCDLLVLDDLMQLWEQPFDDWWCMAIADIACPYVDAWRAMPNYRRACPYLASLRPIANYEQFGIAPDQKYFNSGVLLINLAAWRAHQLTEKLLDCLRDHQKHIWCWDQYALNAQLAGRWRELPLKWNFGTHAFEYPTESHVPMASNEFVDNANAPSIVHFTTENKPWHFQTPHPYRAQFFQFLDQTAWRGWRPVKPDFEWNRWWNRRAAGVHKRILESYRKMTALVHPG